MEQLTRFPYMSFIYLLV